MTERDGESVPVENPERVLLLGDLHGEHGWLKMAARAAVENDCPVILQLGDFGFWPHYGSGKHFLKNVEQTLERYGLELWWVDGNHENHDWLAEQPHIDGFWRMGRTVHIARGARWEWSDVRFLGCGGAYSIDKRRRTEGESWWAGETITEGDVRRCVKGPADVMVTHDAPWGVAGVMGPGTVGDKDSFPESEANRKRVQAIVDAVRPQLLVHGHYHHRNSGMYRGTRIEGFGRDMDAESMAVLDLADLTIRPCGQSKPASVYSGRQLQDGGA